MGRVPWNGRPRYGPVEVLRSPMGRPPDDETASLTPRASETLLWYAEVLLESMGHRWRCNVDNEARYTGPQELSRPPGGTHGMGPSGSLWCPNDSRCRLAPNGACAEYGPPCHRTSVKDLPNTGPELVSSSTSSDPIQVEPHGDRTAQGAPGE